MVAEAYRSGAMVPQTGLKGTGVLVPITGPSGVGKAKLLAAVGAAFGDRKAVRFPRPIEAVIQAKGIADPHANDQADVPLLTMQGAASVQRVSFDQFNSLARAGGLAASWQVHDRHIGIPASIVDDLSQGKVVVVSASRRVIPLLRQQHSRVHVIYVTANRDRKSGSHPKAGVGEIPAPPVTIIDNSGPLTDATEELCRVLETYIP